MHLSYSVEYSTFPKASLKLTYGIFHRRELEADLDAGSILSWGKGEQLQF